MDDLERKCFTLTFVTEQREWDETVEVYTLAEARSAARSRLAAIVTSEAPRNAYVAIAWRGKELGVIDHMDGRFDWTPEA